MMPGEKIYRTFQCSRIFPKRVTIERSVCATKTEAMSMINGANFSVKLRFSFWEILISSFIR